MDRDPLGGSVVHFFGTVVLALIGVVVGVWAGPAFFSVAASEGAVIGGIAGAALYWGVILFVDID